MKTVHLTEITKAAPECPWPADQIRIEAKKLVDRCGGPSGWALLGPAIQMAFLRSEVLAMFQTASVVRPIEMSVLQIAHTVLAMMTALGIDEE